MLGEHADSARSYTSACSLPRWSVSKLVACFGCIAASSFVSCTSSAALFNAQMLPQTTVHPISLSVEKGCDGRALELLRMHGEVALTCIVQVVLACYGWMPRLCWLARLIVALGVLSLVLVNSIGSSVGEEMALSLLCLLARSELGVTFDMLFIWKEACKPKSETGLESVPPSAEYRSGVSLPATSQGKASIWHTSNCSLIQFGDTLGRMYRKHSKRQ